MVVMRANVGGSVYLGLLMHHHATLMSPRTIRAMTMSFWMLARDDIHPRMNEPGCSDTGFSSL